MCYRFEKFALKMDTFHGTITRSFLVTDLERKSRMVKILIIVAAILAVTCAAPVEKKRVPYFELLAPREPFPKTPVDYKAPKNVTLHALVQRLDNFDPSNPDVWGQQFLMNDEFYQPGGPFFVFLGGEWAITEYRMTNSLMYDMSEELGAAIFYLEHRFYGGSRPTPNVSDENLRFLTPEQALADTAHFINHIRTILPGAANSEVILVGGHYSASLAVWFRQRYPHLSTGVWASSPPLPSVVDFDQFKVATGAAYRAVGGDICYNALEQGFNRMVQHWDAGELEILTRAFFVCDPLEEQDSALFFSVLTELYEFLPMFEYEEFIQSRCDDIISNSSSIASIAYILNNFIDIDGGECINIDYDYIFQADRQIEWDSPAVAVGYRQWTFQLCSQIGWFHSSGAENQPFGNKIPVDRYHVGCRNVFGDSFTEQQLHRNSERFNTIYGGLEPQVTNAVFVYGQHDPWSVLGRRTDLSDDAVAIVIPRATMSNELGPRHRDNPPELAETKDRIEELIHQWLGRTN